MFKIFRKFIFALTGSAAAILAVYLIRQRSTRKFHPARQETRINVDEVPCEDFVQTDELISSPSIVEKQAPGKKSTKKSASVAAPAPKSDDLTRIEGIGPKTASILNQAGVTSFQALASLKSEEIKDILRAAKSRGVPTSWPQQAKIAAAGDWNGLTKLQAELKGGL